MTEDRTPPRRLAVISGIGIGRALAQALAGDDRNRSPVVRIEKPEPFPVDVRVRLDPPRKDWKQRERRRPRQR